ncbi:MAG: ATP-binding protein [Candidatus Micrarchaeota archaeon]|nr:ATP-binding protein [Candidatus Micrarchaeota archaeon]
MAKKSKNKEAKGKAAKVVAAKKFDFNSFSSTAEIPVSDKMVDQIIGQEKAVSIIKKASSQKRNVLLIGSPGTGKSMLAQAMAELLPVEALEDMLAYSNPDDENNPVIKVVKAGEGRKIVQENRFRSQMAGGNANIVTMAVIILMSFLLLSYGRPHLGDVITAAMLIGLFVITGMMAFAMQMGKGRALMPGMSHEPVKLLVDNHDKKKAPYVDGSGAKAGSLLGECRHDPLQSLTGASFLQISTNKPQKGKQKKIFQSISFEKLWKRLERKYPKFVEQYQNSYEAIVLPKKEKVYTLGYKDGKPILSRIYSLNRYLAEKETVQLETAATTITLTSDHKLITPNGSRTAKRAQLGQELITLG